MALSFLLDLIFSQDWVLVKKMEIRCQKVNYMMKFTNIKSLCQVNFDQ